MAPPAAAGMCPCLLRRYRTSHAQKPYDEKGKGERGRGRGQFTSGSSYQVELTRGAGGTGDPLYIKKYINKNKTHISFIILYIQAYNSCRFLVF